ncbi:MAG: type II toxin-antitoxin system HicA family toxin [Cyanobium sp. M30B3]|nr:MAG: type II toxin-antitoxin system HicA family toxin [Cyanobium sp. M30B3]
MKRIGFEEIRVRGSHHFLKHLDGREGRLLFPFIRMKRWDLASWQASFVMSSYQELNCNTFYNKLNRCSASRFSGRGQRWQMNDWASSRR